MSDDGMAIIADGMRRLFDAARETERGCMEALQSARVVGSTPVDFGWLLRASRRGEERDRMSAAWQAWTALYPAREVDSRPAHPVGAADGYSSYRMAVRSKDFIEEHEQRGGLTVVAFKHRYWIVDA